MSIAEPAQCVCAPAIRATCHHFDLSLSQRVGVLSASAALKPDYCCCIRVHRCFRNMENNTHSSGIPEVKRKRSVRLVCNHIDSVTL
jgi:hypothetical protein